MKSRNEYSHHSPRTGIDPLNLATASKYPDFLQSSIFEANLAAAQNMLPELLVFIGEHRNPAHLEQGMREAHRTAGKILFARRNRLRLNVLVSISSRMTLEIRKP